MRYAVVPVAGPLPIQRTAAGPVHGVRFGRRLLLWSETGSARSLASTAERAGLQLKSAAVREARGVLHLVVQVGASFQQAHPDAVVVLDKGRHLVVDLDPDGLRGFVDDEERCWQLRPLPEAGVVVDLVAPAAKAPSPAVQAVVDAVARASYHGFLLALTSHPARHSLGEHFTTAANWAADELRRMGYTAELRPISVGSGSSVNVVAERAGGGVSRDLVLVTAHLDSINIPGGPAAVAPGADDNASGAAGLLELGRVLATTPTHHDLRLILFGGEEQGLHGSVQYVAALAGSERARVRAVVNMDMVASKNTAVPTVLLEGASVSATVMAELADAAATYTGLSVETSLNPFASDHVPFINAGIPAVLTIEGADSANQRIHTADDVLDHLDEELPLEILRMNAAVVASRLGVEPAAAPTVAGAVVSWEPNGLDAF
jgi:hypothetical protein